MAVTLSLTPADNSFFKANAVLKLETGLYHHIFILILDMLPKIGRGAISKQIFFIDKQCFPKRVSNYRAFDGISFSL